VSLVHVSNFVLSSMMEHTNVNVTTDTHFYWTDTVVLVSYLFQSHAEELNQLP